MTQFVYLTQFKVKRYNRHMNNISEKLERLFFDLRQGVRRHFRGLKWYFYAIDAVIAILIAGAAIFFVAAKNAPDPRVHVSLSSGGRTTDYLINLPEAGMDAAAFLKLSNTALGRSDKLSVNSYDLIEDGMNISVTRSFPVALRSAGELKLVYTTGGTVGDALRLGGVSYDTADELNHLIFEDLSKAHHSAQGKDNIRRQGV